MWQGAEGDPPSVEESSEVSPLTVLGTLWQHKETMEGQCLDGSGPGALLTLGFKLENQSYIVQAQYHGA